jgi:SAM-dependent methyltransferase
MDNAGGYVDYEFVSDFYDHVYEFRSEKDIPFFVEMAKQTGGPVLEVGCGSGRVLVPTARVGIEIVGLDLSDAMLAKCREKLSSEPEDVQNRVKLLKADMRDFDLGRTFKLITTPFRPFQHLTTVEDQITCLKAIRRHLDGDGRFILDIFNPSIPYLADETRKEEWGEMPEFDMPDGRKVLLRNRVPERNFANQVIDCETIYYVTHPDGRKERLVHSFQMRYIFRFEAEHLLANCGFEIENLYGDFDKSLFGSKYSGELIFVSRKA